MARLRSDGSDRCGFSEIVAASCTPWGIQFLHNLPNKPLTDFDDLQIAENKPVSLQDQQNTRVMVSLELWKTQS
jgi:hypothetical protein